MKEFEEWQKRGLNAYCNLGAELAWKAALDWMLNIIEHPSPNRSLIASIREELES